jgi:hypothetical protein
MIDTAYRKENPVANNQVSISHSDNCTEGLTYLDTEALVLHPGCCR